MNRNQGFYVTVKNSVFSNHTIKLENEKLHTYTMRRGIDITSILHVKIHKLENKIYELGERNNGKTTTNNKRKKYLSFLD